MSREGRQAKMQNLTEGFHFTGYVLPPPRAATHAVKISLEKKKNILKKKIRIKMLDCGINQADVLTREIDTDHILGTLPFDPESVETGKESWRR